MSPGTWCTTSSLARRPLIGVLFSAASVYLDDSRTTVLKILRAAATSTTCSDPLACGFGFVSHLAVRELLADMTPSRFLRIFVDDEHWDNEREAMATSLDGVLGPL
jgi:hypothetical protein